LVSCAIIRGWNNTWRSSTTIDCIINKFNDIESHTTITFITSCLSSYPCCSWWQIWYFVSTSHHRRRRHLPLLSSSLLFDAQPSSHSHRCNQMYPQYQPVVPWPLLHQLHQHQWDHHHHYQQQQWHHQPRHHRYQYHRIHGIVMK
jgi:hypothetical protein